MMTLPQNGSVLIVDDQARQAMPIISALSKKGISTTWYKGNDPDDIPEQPAQNVRLVFMDLQLREGDNDPHGIASHVLFLLENLIAVDNGPFMLVIWSLKDALYGDEVKDRLRAQTNHLRPVCTVTMNKKQCIRQKQDTGAAELTEEVLAQLKKSGFKKDDLNSVAQAIDANWLVDKDAEFEVLPGAIANIERAIAEELKKAGIFHLFVIWENLIKKAAAQTVANISATITHNDHWEQNMRDVFRRMGVARVGQNEVSDEELLKESILTFIQSFTDNLEGHIQKVELPDYTAAPGEQLLKIDEGNINLRLVREEGLVRIYQDSFDKEGKRQIEKLFEAKNLYNLDASVKKSKVPLKQQLGDQILGVYWSVPPRLNSGLHLELNPTNILVPGNIYEAEVKESDREKFANTYFEGLKTEEVKSIRFVELEVSPICDYAQKKWKKSRLVSGVIYSTDHSKKIRKQNEHLYVAKPAFHLFDEYVNMAFDYHLLKALDHEIVEKRKIKYRLRRELLLDIIANVSAHVNRPGISYVE